MSGPEMIMIPPLLDQEGRPSHRKRNAALLGFTLLVIALIIFLLVG